MVDVNDVHCYWATYGLLVKTVSLCCRSENGLTIQFNSIKFLFPLDVVSKFDENYDKGSTGQVSVVGTLKFQNLFSCVNMQQCQTMKGCRADGNYSNLWNNSLKWNGLKCKFN